MCCRDQNSKSLPQIITTVIGEIVAIKLKISQVGIVQIGLAEIVNTVEGVVVQTIFKVDPGGIEQILGFDQICILKIQIVLVIPVVLDIDPGFFVDIDQNTGIARIPAAPRPPIAMAATQQPADDPQCHHGRKKTGQIIA